MNSAIDVALYDARPYDRDYFESSRAEGIGWNFHEFRLSGPTAVSASGAFAVCAFVNDHLDKSCLETLASLGVKMIAMRCAGYNNVDIAAAKALSLAVTRVPAYSPHAVAEHAFGLILCLNRNIHRAYQRIRELNFSLNGLIGFDLVGKTIGILGTGKIGKITAQIARGFEMKVLAYDIEPDRAWAEEKGIEYVDLNTLYEKSNIISLHVPLLPETYHMINADTLGRMKKGVFLINTSRGKVVDTHALIEGLKSGWIGGVALDTYEEEEGVFMEDLSNKILLDDELSRLITFPNVLITAHQGYLTQESLREIARVTVKNILCAANKQPFIPGTCLTD